MMVALLLPEDEFWSTILSIVHVFGMVLTVSSSSNGLEEFGFFWSLRNASFYLYIW